MTSQDPGPKGPGQIKKIKKKHQAASFKLDRCWFRDYKGFRK
jgi:hypothetical protein